MEKEHLEVILESIDSKFDLVIEGYNTLDRKIDTFRDELKEDIALCNVRIDALSVKIDNVESRLNDKIDSVESRLNDKIDSVEKRLGAKIDAVAADLSAHRADTEAHNIYRVREK
jgi:hypothetical protein